MLKVLRVCSGKRVGGEVENVIPQPSIPIDQFMQRGGQLPTLLEAPPLVPEDLVEPRFGSLRERFVGPWWSKVV